MTTDYILPEKTRRYISFLVNGNIVSLVLVIAMFIPGMGNLFVGILALVIASVMALLNLFTIPILLQRYKPKGEALLSAIAALLLSVIYLWLFYRLLNIPL